MQIADPKATLIKVPGQPDMTLSEAAAFQEELYAALVQIFLPKANAEWQQLSGVVEVKGRLYNVSLWVKGGSKPDGFIASR